MPNTSNNDPFNCTPACKAPKKTLMKYLTRSLSLRAFRFRYLRDAVADKVSPRRRRRHEFRSVRAVFWPLVSMRLSSSETDTTGPGSSSTAGAPVTYREPFPSPVTPAYVNMMRLRREAAAGSMGEVVGEAEAEACRSFERYLMEMLVEEKKVSDLMDVEELMRCWNSLKSPLFIEMVCRFYGELCKDLFSPASSHVNGSSDHESDESEGADHGDVVVVAK